MKKTNCYLYTRVSTSMQVDGYSLDAQKEKLRKYADFQDMQVVGEYSDEGKSGKNINGRPQFQQMLDETMFHLCWCSNFPVLAEMPPMCSVRCSSCRITA